MINLWFKWVIYGFKTHFDTGPVVCSTSRVMPDFARSVTRSSARPHKSSSERSGTWRSRTHRWDPGLSCDGPQPSQWLVLIVSFIFPDNSWKEDSSFVATLSTPRNVTQTNIRYHAPSGCFDWSYLSPWLVSWVRSLNEISMNTLIWTKSESNHTARDG